MPKPSDKTIIGVKWAFKRKKDEEGRVVRIKALLVAQGYNQQEGIDYEETYASIARLEITGLMLAFAPNMNFKLYRMNVKSSFQKRMWKRRCT